MVDVSSKDETERAAVARAFVYMSKATLERLHSGDNKKGDVLSTSRIAGIMAAKRTGDLIPLCHPLPLTHVGVRFAWVQAQSALAIEATARCSGKTGVEMEAITAATIAALNVYDMTKGIDRSVRIGDIHVLSKSGGKSGDWAHPDPPGPKLGAITWV